MLISPIRFGVIESYGYGSIPISTIFSGLFTSMNPSYFKGFTRGTRVLTHPHIESIGPGAYSGPQRPRPYPEALRGGPQGHPGADHSAAGGQVHLQLHRGTGGTGAMAAIRTTCGKSDVKHG